MFVVGFVFRIAKLLTKRDYYETGCESSLHITSDKLLDKLLGTYLVQTLYKVYAFALHWCGVASNLIDFSCFALVHLSDFKFRSSAMARRRTRIDALCRFKTCGRSGTYGTIRTHLSRVSGVTHVQPVKESHEFQRLV